MTETTPALEPTTPLPPPESVPYTPEWFAVQLSAQEAMTQQRFALMTATAEYQAWQQAVGALQNTRQLAQLAGAQG